jgi:hypothetical protein
MSYDDDRIIKIFFAGYFNQDWAMDSPTPDDAIRTFIQDYSESDRLRLRAEIQQLLREHDDASLENELFNVLGSYFDPRPDGLTLRHWLTHVIARLA